MIKQKLGFTLIELMVVVAIIGILAAIAIPQYNNLVTKSQEGSTKSCLGTIRSALSIYYGDTEGIYPQDTLDVLTTSSRYLEVIPTAVVPKNNQGNPGHPQLSSVLAAAPNAVDESVTAGGWAYDNTIGNQTFGTVLVNCSHTDVNGNLWTSY